jgi:arsenate reductase (thioredoxin)
MKTLSLFVLSALLLMSFSFNPEPAKNPKSKLLAPVDSYVLRVIKDFDKIPEDRKKALKKLALYVESKVKANETARLTFICTHNSRRSHMSQIWAQSAAEYYGIKGVQAYSGGTEASAFNPRAVKAMEKAGFNIVKTSEGTNPVYNVTYAEGKSIKGFSKKYTDESNPQKDFCAVMTCSQADKNCPFISGASLRVAIPYEDPKAFDGTAEEEAKYDERCRQIATEIFYAFSLVEHPTNN